MEGGESRELGRFPPLLPRLHTLTLAALTSLQELAAGKRAQPNGSCPPPGASCLP